jgi:hypothetical protein
MTDRDAPENDQSMPDGTALWRRVPYWHWVQDDAAPNGRLSGITIISEWRASPLDKRGPTAGELFALRMTCFLDTRT